MSFARFSQHGFWGPLMLLCLFISQMAEAKMELYQPEKGRTFQVSTHSENEGDAWPVAPGEEKVLLEMSGPAIIQNIWMTTAPPPDDTHYLRECVLRMYWDDEDLPSVETPLGDFFGMGFGEYQPWQSEVLGVTSGGYYSYFPMPFRKNARITLTNEGDLPIIVFFHFLGQREVELPNDTLYFHAQWRRENPTTYGQNYLFAHLKGHGYLAGVTHHMQAFSKGDKVNFLEGDEYFFIDGETTASVLGTGTEDYYQGGWYFRDGIFSAPYHGLMRKDLEQMRVSCYRFHLRDRINFETELRAEIEHGQRTYNEANVDYSSVAYWYQSEPHHPFEPLNPDRRRVDPEPAFLLPGAIEFEGVAGSHPYYMCTYNSGWSNNMAGLFAFSEVGEAARHQFTVEATGCYRIGASYIAHDHGAHLQVFIDDQAVGQPVDTYDPDPKDAYLLCRNQAKGHQALGQIDLQAGEHQLEVRVVGKHPDAKSFEALIDCVTVVPCSGPEEQP